MDRTSAIDLDHQRRVGALMRRQFAGLSPDDTLRNASDAMRLSRVRHLPVLETGILVGLLSYRDVLEVCLPQADNEPCRTAHGLDRLLVGDVMRTRPFTVTPERTLTDAAVAMLRLRIGCLPVVEATQEGPRLVGLLTESDLLRAAYSPRPPDPL